MSTAIDAAMDKILRLQLTEYEQERPSLLNALKRHARPILREHGPLAMASLGITAAGLALPATVMAGVIGSGALAAAFAGGGLTGLAAVKFADKPFVRLAPDQKEWADDMRKLRSLMIGAEVAGERAFDSQRMRELADMGWIKRKLSSVPKEVFKVADQMRKIERATYEGIQPDPAERSPIQMLVDARDRRWDALRDNLAALKKVNALWPDNSPSSSAPSP